MNSGKRLLTKNRNKIFVATFFAGVLVSFFIGVMKGEGRELCETLTMVNKMTSEEWTALGSSLLKNDKYDSAAIAFASAIDKDHGNKTAIMLYKDIISKVEAVQKGDEWSKACPIKEVLFIFILSAVGAILAGGLAARKKRKVMLWMLTGAVSWIVALIGLAFFQNPAGCDPCKIKRSFDREELFCWISILIVAVLNLMV